MILYLKFGDVGKEALGKPAPGYNSEMKDRLSIGMPLDVYRNGVYITALKNTYFNRENGETVLAYSTLLIRPYQER
jgi:hypothetical protein